jgi:hypothetical protein
LIAHGGKATMQQPRAGLEGEAMSYVLVRQAILDRASLTAIYENHVCHFSPHMIGKHTNGVPIVVAYQYGGGKPGGLASSREWCWYLLPRLHYVRRNGDKWLSGPIDGRPCDAIREIDVAA